MRNVLWDIENGFTSRDILHPYADMNMRATEDSYRNIALIGNSFNKETGCCLGFFSTSIVVSVLEVTK
jgi:hypothetical protein